MGSYIYFISVSKDIKKHPLENRTNVQIKGGGQRPFEQCSKKLHFFEMSASLSKHWLVVLEKSYICNCVCISVFLCAFVFVFERCDDWKPITRPAERGVALKGHQLPRARFVTRSLQSISTTPPTTSYSDLSLRLLKQSFAKACNLFCNQEQFITQH